MSIDPLVDIKSDDYFMKLHEYVKPYTVTSIERQYALYQAMNYILDNGVAGDIVECGVYKGGSMMLVGRMIADRQDISSWNYPMRLFDLFERGMPDPGPEDTPAGGVQASHFTGLLGCRQEEVVANIRTSGYDGDIYCYPGDVVETTKTAIRGGCVDTTTVISLLRLDTDWYESTKAELYNLYHKVNKGGVIIYDDYGHWLGSKKAIDEFHGLCRGSKPILHRLDYSGRMVIKP